jgi:hypothetical protein
MTTCKCSNTMDTQIWLIILRSFYRGGMLFLKAVQQAVEMLESVDD